MKYLTGTATDPVDYRDKLIAFLTTDVDLVADGEEWTVVWSDPDNDDALYTIVLKGTGSAGLDEIFIGMQFKTDIPSETAQIEILGLTGLISTATDLFGHVNPANGTVRLFADINPFTYHFVANGRRFMLLNKISTSYEFAHAGYFLPYLLPDKYAEPLMVSGMAHGYDANNTALEPTIDDWRSTDSHHTNLGGATRATFGNPVFGDYRHSACQILTPSYTWSNVEQTTTSYTATRAGIAPICTGLEGQRRQLSESGRDKMLDALGKTYGGGQFLVPLTLIDCGTQTTLGVVDGLFYVTGRLQSSDSVITVGAEDYLVFQNAFRTGRQDYLAMRIA